MISTPYDGQENPTQNLLENVSKLPSNAKKQIKIFTHGYSFFFFFLENKNPF